MREEKGGKLSTQDAWAGVLPSKHFSVHSVSSVVKSLYVRKSRMTAQ
jgi:hypothetical protein